MFLMFLCKFFSICLTHGVDLVMVTILLLPGFKMPPDHFPSRGIALHGCVFTSTLSVALLAGYLDSRHSEEAELAIRVT